MTVGELAQRLARWSTAKTLSQMTVEDRQMILDCINSGIFNWFAAAPDRMRMTSASHLIRESESVTCTVTEGENTLDGLVLQDYHLGCSIDLGDQVMNEIISVDGTPEVLNQHRVSGTVNGTIYFDAAMLTDYYVRRLVNHPRIPDKGVELIRDDEGMQFKGAERRGASWGPAHWWDVANTRNFGTPSRYVFENTGVSLGDEARLMIRMDPIPTESLLLQFDAEFDAPTYDLHHMEGEFEIPVPDPYVLPHLLPLALGDLAESPIWGGSEKAADKATEKSVGVIAKIQGDVPRNHGAPKNRVRTRPGW